MGIFFHRPDRFSRVTPYIYRKALTEFCLYGCNTSISLKRYKQQQNTCIVSTIFYTFAKT
ncbi:hypothetical protein HMPREF9419_1707 [Prevotella nigrescens ATCC 33563]|nr:hypothetical protein HMPREF9419_1707 [Prevotella nigrescens ATCC 33563]